MGISQMCTGARDYFRTSKPHSEKLCIDFIFPYAFWAHLNSETCFTLRISSVATIQDKRMGIIMDFSMSVQDLWISINTFEI